MTFSLLVQLIFKTLQDKEIFHHEFAIFAKWVEENERKTTTTYKLLQSDKDQLTVLVLERYINKMAYIETHKSSREFQHFRSILASLDPVVNGHSYADTDIGYF